MHLDLFCATVLWGDEMSTGKRIQEARKKAGLTQKELGERLGISYQTIAQWENDLRNPKITTLQKIAGALGIDWTNLADDSVAAAYDAGYEEGVNNGTAMDEWQNNLIDALWERQGYSYSDTEISLIGLFSKLNDEGQTKAVESVELLTKIPELKKEPPQD